jgi:hypothetical protein
MAQDTKLAKLGKLQKFRNALNANSESLPHLEGSRTEYDELVGGVLELVQRQGALTAEKQEISKNFRETLIEAERLGTVLRLAVKQHFGIRAEKLAEFGLQPFRGRKKPDSVETSPTELTQ